MYYIGGRYYDPDIKRYISAVNPEEMLNRAGTVLRLCFIADLYELFSVIPFAVTKHALRCFHGRARFVCCHIGIQAC